MRHERFVADRSKQRPLKHDAATSAVEIVSGAFEYVDVPADLAQQITREESTKRPTNNQRPARV